MGPQKKGALLILLALVLLVFHAQLQPSISALYSFFREFIQVVTREERRYLKEVFPAADTFSSKEGEPPHYRAYRIDPQTNGQALVGFVFFTTDVEPGERAYEGPITIAVGMTTEGMITGIKVVEHHEPYGYFSIELPAFASQFRDKSILDRFVVGIDIDAVTRATISVAGGSRVIRKSARRIAQQYLLQEEERRED
jgi:NosR/NirI family nitrous oxide reductase transcriptional regulator